MVFTVFGKGIVWFSSGYCRRSVFHRGLSPEVVGLKWPPEEQHQPGEELVRGEALALDLNWVIMSGWFCAKLNGFAFAA